MDDNNTPEQTSIAPDKAAPLSKQDNVAPFPDKDSARLPAIKESAAAWLVRINSGDFDESQQQALAEWVAEDPMHRDVLFKYAKQWDSMAVLSDLATLFPLPDTNLRQAPPRSTAKPSLGWWGNIGESVLQFTRTRLTQSAVAFSLACALAIVAIPGLQQVLFGLGAPHYQTAIGERSTFTLSDGSVVTLNTNSELTVHFSEARRDIRLSRGEATFNVAKNRERPFVVRAGDGVVWAVGTAFNVRYASSLQSSNAAVDVMVTEGTVKVFTDIGTVSDAKLTVDADELQRANQAANPASQTKASPPIELLPERTRESLLTVGQALRYTEVIKAREQIAPAQMAKQLAWREGVIIFDGETLE